MLVSGRQSIMSPEEDRQVDSEAGLRLVANLIDPKAGVLIYAYRCRMIPVVGVQPDSLRLHSPFLAQRHAQQPRAEPPALRRRDQAEILQLGVRRAALEFAEAERAIVTVSQYINPAAVGCEEVDELRAGHLQPLIPAKR